MSREEWARSGQGKKAERSRCGLEIEAERSDDGLRLDMPNRGRIGRVRPNDGDTTERQARHTAWRGPPGNDEETRSCTAEGFPGPSDHDRNHDDADRNTPTVGRRRKTVDTGIDRHPGQPGDPLRPISPAWLGQEAGTIAIPGRRPWHNDARKKGPAARRGLRAFEKGEPSGESVRRWDGKRHAASPISAGFG